MKEFLDRVRNGGDDEEVELSPAAGPGADDDDAAERAAGRLRDEVASSTGSEVELSDAGAETETGPADDTEDTTDTGTGVGAGMLPGTGPDPDEGTDTDTSSGRAGDSASVDEASIERVVEQNERIIALLERLVDGADGVDGVDPSGTDNDAAGTDATPQSLW